jgi:hypothetical protein
MKVIGLSALLAIALALPAGADEKAVEFAGVWFGTHFGISIPYHGAVLPSEGGPSASDSAGSGGFAQRALDRGLLVLELEKQDADIGGSITLASPDRKKARAVSAIESLGMTPPMQYSGIRSWSSGAITGTVEDERISFTALTKIARISRGIRYAARGKVDGDKMRLRVTRIAGDGAMVVRLQRCVAPPDETLVEACSVEAIWRRYLKTID